MNDNLIKTIIALSAIFLTIVILSGCSTFEQKINKHNDIIKCYPEDAVGCIGWLGNKPLYIEEDL